MTFRLFLRVLVPTCLCAWVLSATAHEAGSPETMTKLRADVEQYFQAHPSSRPDEKWLIRQPASTCKQPRLPKALARDELSGVTVLKYQVDPLGKARNAYISHSSGWAVLDEAALEGLALCVLTAADPSEWQVVSYLYEVK